MIHENIRNIRYIGLVGMPLSGKDTAGEYLSKKFKFIPINMHSIILEEVKKRKIESTRENFQRIAMKLRDKEGADVVAKRIVNDWIPYLEMNITRANEVLNKYPDFEKIRYVIMGVRNFEEVLYFRETFKDQFILIAILAPQKIRYERAAKRNRKGFDVNLSFNEFLKHEICEVSELKLGSSIALADHYIINTRKKEDLFREIDKIIGPMLTKTV